MEENNLIKITLNDKIISLKISEFNTDIDMDDILKIDYGNIVGEVLTFPVIVNKIGNLRAEVENKLSESKFDLQIYGAKLKEITRKNKSTTEMEAGGAKKVKAPTVQEIENSVLLDEGYQLKQKQVFAKQKDYDFLDALYWAAKDKSKKLDWCSNAIKPSDFEHEILEGTINNVMIKSHTKLIN